MDTKIETTVVVTGAAGFVGRALASRLATTSIARGQRLILVDRTSFRCSGHVEEIVGDIGESTVLAAIVACRPATVFHLSAVPGGTSESDPALSRRVNLDATLALVEALGQCARPPRLVYASSIAVFGTPLPEHVDDGTLAQPSMTYGAHKLMVEIALSDAVRRGDLDAVAVRLPGVVARPTGPSGLKSAFLSDLFHRLREHAPITLPVGPTGQVWITSLACCIDNLMVAATASSPAASGRTAMTMPALHIRIDDLVREIAKQTGADDGLVDYVPDAALERQFATYPPLATPAAHAWGLRHDGDLAAFVARTLAGIASA